MKYTFTFEDQSNGEEYQIEANYIFLFDSNYGADIDGNRGIDTYFLDDFSFSILDQDNEDITQYISLEAPSLYNAIESEVERIGLDLDPNDENNYSFDYDYDLEELEF